MSNKERIDEKLLTWISKKLMVMLIATTALFTGHIIGMEWVFVAVVYLFVVDFKELKEIYALFKK